MEPQVSIPNSSQRSSKRLLFDRRYGWVIDEWKDPSEEALEGGRGMFCILPLAKALVQTVTQSINLAATATANVLAMPQEITPLRLHSAPGNGLWNLASFLPYPWSNDPFPNKNSHLGAPCHPSHLPTESDEHR